ncbi:kinesin-like protein Klp61F [Musca vetustissima]|uniref:kinesin-like protein Klp61F n=1 Tax=Musca vetustissima TaxID=27455 RepID=UPI002AB7484E|nr:kinesin-like protein Klp61F [Musca vetustissima]
MKLKGNMNTSAQNHSQTQPPRKTNEHIQVYVRVRPLNRRERGIHSTEIVEVISHKEIIARNTLDSKLTKKFTFDRTFGPESKQVDVYAAVVGPLIEEVLSGYNCTVFAYGQTGTGKTHTMVGNECAELKSSWEDDSDIGIIPRALCHLFDELRMMELEFSMRISYLELYNEELFDLLSTDDSTKIRIFDDSTKKGSVIIQGLEEIPVHSKDDVYKLLEKGKERRRTASTLMNAQSSRSHTVFSIVVHIKENGMDGEEMLKIGKLNLVDLAGSENVSKAGNEKGVRVRETVNINQSLLTLGRVITALVERTPHIPYRESKLTRLLQESLGGRTKTSIIATISPGHKDIEETLSTLEYAHRAKNIQNKPEVNQKLTKKTVLKEYTEEIDKLKRDLMAARDKNGVYLATETYNEMTLKMDSQTRELNEKVHLLKALKEELASKEKIFNEVSMNLIEKTTELQQKDHRLKSTKGELIETKKVLKTTKRRYKEKKVLLESHAKTEEVLKDQATQILEVADIATKDTEALHETIDRRKDVDVKIQTACERFAERMNENFDHMDESLKQYEEKQSSLTKCMDVELTKTSNLQTKLVDTTSEQIKNIHQILDTYETSMVSITETVSSSLTDLGQAQYESITKFLKELKEKEQTFKMQIKENLEAIEYTNEQQQIALSTMSDSIKAKLHESNTKLQQHTKRIQTEMDAIKQKTLENTLELQKISSTLAEQRALIEGEQKLLEEFQQKMTEFHKKHTICSNNIDTNVGTLEKAQQFVTTQLEGSTKFQQAFLEKKAKTLENNCQLVDKLKDEIELHIDQNVAKCSTLAIQLDNKVQDTTKSLDTQIEAVAQNYAETTEALKDYGPQVKRICSQNREQHNVKTDIILNSLQTHVKQTMENVSIVKGYNCSLQQKLKDYTKVYKEQIQTCSQDVETFRKNEVKTYTATGATPSKKEFKYPRVLAATSPHTNIVKRFRQENDWSDVDMTIPLDEESETDIDNSISDTETILNSTPVETEVVPPNRNSYITQRKSDRNSNLLKVPPQKSRSGSPAGSISPRKGSSRTNSPAYLKQNKENIAT